jgi:hypothetical protein
MEPSLCASFHTAEELAGQMATMQVSFTSTCRVIGQCLG